MSRRHLLVLVALTPVSDVLLRKAADTASGPPVSIADLLLKDDIQQVEADSPARSPNRRDRRVSGRNRIPQRKFRKSPVVLPDGDSDERKNRARPLRSGQAGPGQSEIEGSPAIDSNARSNWIPTNRSTTSMPVIAADLEKNTAESKKQLEEYVRLESVTTMRIALTEAKAGLALVAAFGNKEYAVVEGPGRARAHSLRKALNLIFADVKINGKGPYNFVVDTGASQTALSQKLARDLGLKVITSTVMHGVGGSGKVNSKIYRIDQSADWRRLR